MVAKWCLKCFYECELFSRLRSRFFLIYSAANLCASQTLSISYKNYPKIRVNDKLTYKDYDISCCTSSRLLATKSKEPLANCNSFLTDLMNQKTFLRPNTFWISQNMILRRCGLLSSSGCGPNVCLIQICEC